MLPELITKEVVKKVGLTVGQYIFGRVRDDYFDNFTAKQKLKKILKKDEENINQQFQKKLEKEETTKIEEFFFKDIFQDIMFLYPVSDLPIDRVDILESRFLNYTKKIDWKDAPEISVNDLVSCVNKHNELIDKYLLSDSEHIMLKTIQRNQSDLLGYIGKTLDSNSELQIEDKNLDYSSKQIEGILHAMRMDMKHYKFLMMVYSLGILILITIAIVILPRIIGASNNLHSISRGLIVICMFFVFALFLLLFLFILALKNVNIREGKILKYMGLLWQLHFSRYEKILNVDFKPDEQKC